MGELGIAALHKPWAPTLACQRDLVGGDREERGPGREISTPPRIGRPHRITGARADISSANRPHPFFYSPLESDICCPLNAPAPSQSFSASPQHMISETASAAAAMKKPLSASLGCCPRAPPPRLLTAAWLRLRCESGLGRWS